MQAPPTYQGGPSFSEQEELAYYQGLFAEADTDGSGRISGEQAARFLFASGLERKVLKQIWDIADSATRGELGPEEFCVASRLIAHAQAGRPISRDLVYQEPPGPPRFDSPGGAGAAPAQPEQAPQPDARQRGRSPPPGEDRQLPSARDLRKYGRLFYAKIILNGAAMMGAAEAKDLFERSGLGNDVLQQVWYLADHDSDGHLSWPEFVLAMHLIRRSLAGQALPQPPANWPRDLVELLDSLEPAEAYARQPSRSPRSLSGASTPFGSTTPERRGTEEAIGSNAGGFPEGSAPGGFGVGGEEAPASAPAERRGGSADFGAGAGADAGGSGFGEGFEAGTPEGGAFANGVGSPSRKGRHSRKSKDSDAFSDLGDAGAFGDLPRQSHQVAPSFSDESGFGSEARFEAEYASSSRPGRGRRRDDRIEEERQPEERQPEEHRSPDFGERPRIGSGLLPMGATASSQPVEHLEVLIEAEKTLVQRLRLDTNTLHEELSRLEEACREEERAAIRERSECDRIGREREILMQQLEASQRQIHELKAEHKGLHLESVLLRRDTDHYGKEASFLQRLLDEETRDSQVLQQSIEYLEQSNQNLTAHTKALEEARKDVLAQVNAEKELLQKEEREAILAKNALETLKTGGGAETLARFAASRQASEAQGLPNDGLQRRRLSSVDAPPWSGGFPAPADAGGGGIFSDWGMPPSPLQPPVGKEPPAGRQPVKVPTSLQLREGV
uniref:Calmodulin n=1 Tax=Alexandrium monilatum TaxID=311494 RepID=A0A7S4SPV5_9DINO|mmetsp:Transcript_81568/g.243203  ORF Transcript_81568/g.243203 Transcript_81568/m.243203 type:complete len:730 (+) Transcript_81568:124-2313(+)